MDARMLPRAAWIAAILLASSGASYRTPNYVVQTADAQFAETMGKAAETYRHDLAIEWLGTTIPNWSKPCIMNVQAAPNLGAGGATTFVVDRGEVFGWRMTIQGSQERLLDSVLPHEVTHMIFASHFRQPVPRWADEGGATTVEHSSEKAKHRRMLVEFLHTNRGIAFNQMFAMTEYPRDVMPLYAQGFSLAEYLIEMGGKREFVAYLDEGMKTNRWSAATQHHYGIDNLGALQKTWVGWVAQGSPALKPKTSPSTGPTEAVLVSNDKLPRPAPNLIYHMSRPAAEPVPADSPDSSDPGTMVRVVRPGQTVAPPTSIPPVASTQQILSAGWQSMPVPAATSQPSF
jgi:hypothetical protein